MTAKGTSREWNIRKVRLSDRSGSTVTGLRPLETVGEKGRPDKSGRQPAGVGSFGVRSAAAGCRFPVNKLAHLYTIRYSVPYKVHDGRRPGAAKNPADLLPHEGGKRARAGMAEGIPEAERQAIGKDLLRAQWRWPVGMPLCRPLGDGLWEVRTDLPTKKTARVLLCLYREHLVALHGFIKKTRTTPDEDLALARKRQKELEQ